MARQVAARRIHDVRARESWDKVVLALAFFAGVGGGVALKILGVHPFLAAGFSALVLVLYAAVAYASTSLRLEPEVIGDNTYYLGFLFTLTSLSVTLYFVVESGAEDRAALIPEVISGFGVALVSTIVGVFIRVLMMQFRLDVVSRERETRVEIDQAARQLRTELAHSLQQMKLFTVESLQRSAERESEFQRATDTLVKETHKALSGTAVFLHQEVSQVFRDQSKAAVDAIRATIAQSSEAALSQIKTSFGEIGTTSEGLRASHAVARNAVDQANATLLQQTGTMTDLVGQMARRLRATSDEVETSSANLSRSLTLAAEQLGTTLADASGTLGESLLAFEKINRTAAARSQLLLNELETKLTASAERLALATNRALVAVETSASASEPVNNETS